MPQIALLMALALALAAAAVVFLMRRERGPVPSIPRADWRDLLSSRAVWIWEDVVHDVFNQGHLLHLRGAYFECMHDCESDRLKFKATSEGCFVERTFCRDVLDDNRWGEFDDAIVQMARELRDQIDACMTGVERS